LAMNIDVLLLICRNKICGKTFNNSEKFPQSNDVIWKWWLGKSIS